MSKKRAPRKVVGARSASSGKFVKRSELDRDKAGTVAVTKKVTKK